MNDDVRAVTDTALILGATMRLTRLVVTDDLGQWWIRDPLDAWVHEHPAQAPDHKWLGGLTCPHCVSFHAAWIVLGTYHLSGLHPKARAVWRFGAAALSLSSIVGHASARLD